MKTSFFFIDLSTIEITAISDLYRSVCSLITSHNHFVHLVIKILQNNEAVGQFIQYQNEFLRADNLTICKYLFYCCFEKNDLVNYVCGVLDKEKSISDSNLISEILLSSDDVGHSLPFLVTSQG
jgi:hypothetical protein